MDWNIVAYTGVLKEAGGEAQNEDFTYSYLSTFLGGFGNEWEGELLSSQG